MANTNSIERLLITLEPLDTSRLERQIDEIKPWPQASFFTQELWLKNYWQKALLQDECLLAKVLHEISPHGQISRGTYFISKANIGIGPFKVKTRYCINESISPGFGDLTIEHNDVINLGEKSVRRFDLLFHRLIDQSSDEVYLSGLSAEILKEIREQTEKTGYCVATEKIRRTYWIDLESLKAGNSSSYLSQISSNTRELLRRQRRKIEKEIGPIYIEYAKSLDQKLEWFSALGKLHSKRWAGTDPQAGFANRLFVEFHSNLFNDSNAFQSVEIARIGSEANTIGYLHFFVSRNTLYFHAGAFDLAAYSRYSPGLLCHWLAIEDAIANEKSRYDFLAGTFRYKASLATHQSDEFTVVVYLPTALNKAERFLRTLKRKIRARNIGLEVEQNGE